MNQTSKQKTKAWLLRIRGLLLLVFGLVLGIGIGLLVFWAAPVLTGEVRRLPPSVGLLAEDFQLKGLDGAQINLFNFRGRPVLINFWATWCQPCREEMPLFEETARELGDRLVIVGVNVAEEQGTISQYVRELGIQFPIALDSEGEVSKRYFVRSYPSSFFVDSQGTIRALHLGAMTAEQLTTYLETIGIKQ